MPCSFNILARPCIYQIKHSLSFRHNAISDLLHNDELIYSSVAAAIIFIQVDIITWHFSQFAAPVSFCSNCLRACSNRRASFWTFFCGSDWNCSKSHWGFKQELAKWTEIYRLNNTPMMGKLYLTATFYNKQWGELSLSPCICLLLSAWMWLRAVLKGYSYAK